MEHDIYENLKNEYMNNPVKSEVIKIAREKYGLSLEVSKKILDEIADEAYEVNKQKVRQENVEMERTIHYGTRHFSFWEYCKHTYFWIGYVFIIFVVYIYNYNTFNSFPLVRILKRGIETVPIVILICVIAFVLYSIWHFAKYCSSYFDPRNPYPYYVVNRPYAASSVRKDFPEQSRASMRNAAYKEYVIRKITNIEEYKNKIVITGTIGLANKEMSFDGTQQGKSNTINQLTIPKY